MNVHPVTVETRAQENQAKSRHEIPRLDLVLALLSCFGNGQDRKREDHSTVGAGEHLAWSTRHTGHWFPRTALEGESMPSV